MTKTRPSLWPTSEPHPYRRLAAAMVLTPLIWGGLGTLVYFLTAGASESEPGAVWDYTLDGMILSFGGMFAFTFTFGLAGVLVLWWFGLRGVVIWALTGGLMGAVVATLASIQSGGMTSRSALIVFIVLGWSIFLTIRALAGVRDADE